MDVLLVVDVEGGFGWGADLTQYDAVQARIANNIKAILAKLRKDGTEIIFVMYPFFSSYDRTHTTQLMRSILPFNSWEEWSKKLPIFYRFNRPNDCLACENPQPLAPFLAHCHDPFEPVFFKNHMDAFNNPDLIKYLRDRNVKSIGLAGCSTTACVKHTACGAVKNGFRVELLRDCVSMPFGDESQEQQWLAEVREENCPEYYTVSVEIV